MRIEMCLCGQKLSMPISTKKWNCIKCGRQWELAEIVENFTPKEINGIGLYNKIKRNRLKVNIDFMDIKS